MGSFDTDIYSKARDHVRAQYDGLIAGAPGGIFVAIFSKELTTDARFALERSAESLGYGTEGVTYVTLDANKPLPTDQIREIVEGLDPLCIVACDSGCSIMLEKAYRTSIPAMGSSRLCGRSVRSFPDFSSLMKGPSLKQQAWAQLKTLPKLI